MPRILTWALLACLLAPTAARAAPPSWCVVLLQPAVVRAADGRALSPAPAYSAWDLLRAQGTRLWVRLPSSAQGWLPADHAQVLLGSARHHRPRLNRLTQANLPPSQKRRLAAGRIQPGDTLWLVELAWGRPQRSFMVNYFRDEQHYVYFLPGGRKVLLRFLGGRLAPPVAAPTRRAAARLEAPTTPR